MLIKVKLVIQQESGYIGRIENGNYVCLFGEHPTGESETIELFLPDNLKFHRTLQEAAIAYCNIIGTLAAQGAYPLTFPE